MTIAIAVRTGSSVVFAADSKVTTSGIIGLDEKGLPRWVEQTYDNATKIVHDRSQTVMALIAGEANIGQESAMDFIMGKDFGSIRFAGDQDEKLSDFVGSLVDLKKNYWASLQVPLDRWPGPTILMAAPSPTGSTPRIWRVDLHGMGRHIEGAGY